MRSLTTLIAAVFTLVSFALTTNIVVKDGMYFNEDGSLFSGEYEQFESGIKLATISVNNGLLSGSAVYYHANGAIKEEGTFINGKRSGSWFQYTSNGELTSVAAFHNDKKEGKWVILDDAGKVRFEMYYSEGKKVGTWKMWDAEGTLTTKTFEQ